MTHASRTIANAKVVLAEEVIEGGIRIENGRIVAIHLGTAVGAGAEDFEGDYLAPGVVDLHTDNLERHFFPRPNIDWDPMSAAIVHDGVCVSVGVTTVYDSLSVGSFGRQQSRTDDNLTRLINGLHEAKRAGALKADHRLHWRCELPADNLRVSLEPLMAHPMTGLASLMDHTPGQRQYMHLDVFLDRVWRKEGVTEAEINALLDAQRERQARNVPANRAFVAAAAKAVGAPLAAHDDETAAHVEDAAAVGAVIAEFPVTAEAAQRSRELGLTVIMGGPNLIRGGSYSGNLGAAQAAQAGVLDGFASDYVPRSLIECAFAMTAPAFGWSLSQGFAAVAAVPAQAVGLTDRGVIAEGKRADLVRVRLADRLPVVRGVWVEGARAA